MRFTKKLEMEVLATLATTPSACIVFPDSMYRPDGSILIHRNNLAQRMHRYLYTELTGKQLHPRVYLHPGKCKTPGCMNPFHRIPSRRSSLGRVTDRCINGHRYTPQTTFAQGRDRCRVCHEARLARRRTGNRRKGWCLQGHRLTDGNSYISVDSKGREHRRCRKCTLDKVRERRANERRET